MSKEHFKQLYKIAKEEGLSSAWNYDKEITEQRNTFPLFLYREAKKGYALGNWNKSFDEPILHISLVPVRMIGGIARGTTLPLETLLKLLSSKKIK